MNKKRVYFYYPEKKYRIEDRRGLKQAISELFWKERREVGRINYIFCSDEYLLLINRQYLNHDYYTDIITFDLSSDTANVVSDIYVSVDRVSENAKTLGIPRSRELVRVIFHGALHLCGYKDKSQSDISAMRRKENYYLKQYFKDSH
ncbi:MAG: rRNA maturation RNase YbeY [Ferruginibacter sp.]